MTNSSDCNRPIHTNMAVLLRRMQMSNIPLFIFVEGDEDTFFYASLCLAMLAETSVRYNIFTPKHIPGSPSGKKALTDLFKYLDSQSSLLSDLAGKKTGILFFLDKDLDDLMGIKINSEHVAYTYFYDVENHIIEYGDLKKGCAVAATMDPREVDCCIGNQTDWLRNAAQKWKEWVKICVFSRVKILDGCPLNYGRDSQINDPQLGDVDEIKYKNSLATLKFASKLSDTEFSDEYDRISKLVEDLYKKGEHGKVFKGKWYKHFLDEQIRKLLKTVSGSVDGFERQIFKHIEGTLDFKADWAEHFKQPLKRVIDRLI